MKRAHVTRGRLAVVFAVVVGGLLGAVVGQPGSGRAAPSAVPKNKTLPTVSGSAEVGQTLVATHGTWSGSPTRFRYQWSQCDTTGNACLAIGGATARIYTVRAADVGHTFRLTVTAFNSSGGTDASSAATPVVPPSGCPAGTGTIPIAQLAPPARLVISHATVTPRLTRSTRMIRFRFEITACDGRPVQGATVLADAIPYNQFAPAQGTTGADGTVTFTELRRRGFPASAHQRLLAVFARAWKQGDPLLFGVSASRVVAFPVHR